MKQEYMEGCLQWPRPPVFAPDGTLAEPYGEKVPWVEIDGRWVEADPVLHPEGREDPEEYA
ncbi:MULTISPECIES: hypothetical protein [unclassified Bradyrhizobium]|uniref:hypothetical protein n=1 Tax=unclassified Bradyrhizobium TaxID=2631580 RepID=UPI0024E11520|nr:MULTISPECIES: hypothetical protein [unclassified Bradyrhizobium]